MELNDESEIFEALIASIIQATEEMKANFNQTQLRDDAGRWADTGGGMTGMSAGNQPPKLPKIGLPRTIDHIQIPQRRPALPAIDKRLRQVPDYQTGRRAMAAYGETGGLTPMLKDPHGNPFDPKNWDSASAAKLAQARIYIGIVSQRNPKVNFLLPSDPSNPLQARAWNFSVDAAIEGAHSEQLPDNVNHFFLRQDGIGQQKPDWPPRVKKRFSMGPFHNAGSRSKTRSHRKTYIDFSGEDK
jgi:hypothetical protein